MKGDCDGTVVSRILFDIFIKVCFVHTFLLTILLLFFCFNYKDVKPTSKWVCVSADGQHVWGVNENDEIYYRFGKDGKWEKIDGRLTQISVSADGQHVWGVNKDDDIFYRFGKNGKWEKKDGI